MNFELWSTCAVLICVSVATWTDLRSGLIPNWLTYSGCIVIFALSYPLGDDWSAFGGAVVGAGTLFMVYFLTRGRGIGLGDVKLALSIGAALGAMRALEALAVAYIFGACIAIVLLFSGRATRSDRIPFAPFLACGTCCMLLFGDLVRF